MLIYDENKDKEILRWQKRYESLPEDVRRRLDEWNEMISQLDRENRTEEYQLRVIKRSRVEPKAGDVFVLSPREGLYFYGKVMVAKIKNETNSFINGAYSVFIFKCKSRKPDMSGYKPDYNNLLIPPAIVPRWYWTSGRFYNVGHEEITEEEKRLDYGFYEKMRNIFRKEDGTILKREPKIWGGYGITTYIGIAYAVQRELVIDPSLAEFDE
ncbi:immunity protein 26 of polymorphic toxin system [Caldicellulosiruptor bescii]|uniref:Uncharacterized protein n=2 Tax=Caldicellulosiruptor bescii TaxID=31899 RepID=B9MN38_CALBD|nr:immunity 26/phosphotriesterase HocA family protein [Caldicellulosiruptor bescii]ACM59494.1 hypothetical protein Athe_0358 [Caldicellulosiruptor bescii DSM 6725]PBC89526.1 immunity protein 26 of polymorphic toxin system [Caldicellulosiruptor bescii]PBC89848.1 immunity protein 26 of polymorphic toxin system [Caldicellulosiruptor bescii]PBD04725.1 immunity protein 26 of polymorphic toxin system [Caldicellulosiruptor bescii]PBD05644.1 immunity protein 26 of polymorphic toxin system [Caldicellul